MRIETSQQDKTFRVRLHDRMSFSDHALFRDALGEIRKATPSLCVIEMENLVSIDSAGLGMLMIAHEEAKKGGWGLRLQAPQEQVRKLLHLACMDKVLTIS
ncbi:MAG: STAS domain-containing protein [Proteobacteria bacterium]|nr:STAS domain-containing protein [Pseudomonadota bacterium]